MTRRGQISQPEQVATGAKGLIQSETMERLAEWIRRRVMTRGPWASTNRPHLRDWIAAQKARK